MRPCDGLLTKCSCHGDHRCPSQALWGHGQPCVVTYQSRSGLPPCGSGTAPGQKKTACWSQFSILLCQSPFFEAGPVARLQKPGFDTIGLKIEGRRPKSSVFARWSRLKIGYSLYKQRAKLETQAVPEQFASEAVIVRAMLLLLRV